MVAAAGHQWRCPGRGRDLSHLGLAGQRGLLLEALHFPALLAVPGDHVHEGLGLRLDPVADLAHPSDHHHRRPAGVPAYLLLLPEGLLPRLLAGAGGVRGPRTARQGHRRDQVPADPAERAPLLLLDRAGVQRDPLRRCGDRVPEPRRAVGAHGPGHADPGGQRRAAVAVLAVLSRLPSRHRRPAQALLQAPGQVLDVDPGVQAERPAHAVRLDLAVLGAVDRPLHPAGGERRHLRSSFLLGRRCTAHMTDIQRLRYDVVVIGAGGSGLRAAIEARQAGKKTAVISKSLFGKAHTVMAEGGCAAAMGNMNPNDNWMVHFRDTMRGGKFLNNWRMAELHAKEAPDRVWELEAWGALFDRTPDGKISQRNFGGHQYPRLAHVGDRTGLEMIRTLQQRVVALQQEDAREHGDPEAMIKVFAETTITELAKDGDRIAGAFGYLRDSGRFVLFEAPAVILATGGIGKTFKYSSNSWEYTGDGHALALLAGATLMNMEFVQFHPTHMVWPLSVRGLLVTESVRGDGGVLRNSEGKRFMFGYVPDVFRAQYAETEEEADRWYTDPDHNRRPPELLPRDEVARANNAEVKAGRGSPHGGVFLDIASRLPADEILRRLPSMYHQFKELADVDITKEPMEVGPAQHYVMGGVEVDPDTGESCVPGLFAAGEVSGGMHGSNRLGGNSLSDLLVFGRRAGLGAAEYIDALAAKASRPAASDADLDTARTEA